MVQSGRQRIPAAGHLELSVVVVVVVSSNKNMQSVLARRVSKSSSVTRKSLMLELVALLFILKEIHTSSIIQQQPGLRRQLD